MYKYNKVFFLLLFLLTTLCLLTASTSTHASTFTATTHSFDSYTLGSLHGQDGWSTTIPPLAVSTSTVVTTGGCRSGSCVQAISGHITHSLATSSSSGSLTAWVKLPATTTYSTLGIALRGSYGTFWNVVRVNTHTTYLDPYGNELPNALVLEFPTANPNYRGDFHDEPLYYNVPFQANAWHKFDISWHQDSNTTDNTQNCLLSVTIDNAYTYDASNPGVDADTGQTFCGFQDFIGVPTAFAFTNIYAATTSAWFVDDLAVTTLAESISVPSCEMLTEGCYSNVMFLPGFMGSRLYRPDYANATTTMIWGSGTNHSPLGVSTSSILNDSSNDIYTKEASIIDTAYLIYPIYRSFIDQMNTLTSSNTINDWQPIAYDWRLDYEELLTQGKNSNGNIYYHGLLSATSTSYITQELKRLAASSKTGKVTIVAHSNGGLLAKALLSHPEYAQYVDKLVMVATPQLGTPKAIGALLHGMDQGLPLSSLPVFLNDAEARSSSITMPSAYNLLPSNNYFTYTDDPVITFNTNLTLLGTSTGNNWRSLYTDPATPSAGIHSTELLHNFVTDTSRTKPAYADTVTPEVLSTQLFNNAQTTHTALDNWTPPSHIQVFTIAGWGEETLAGVDYRALVDRRKCFSAPNSTPSYCATYKLGYSPKVVVDGDGTVVVSSAMYTNNATSTKRFWVDLKTFNGNRIGSFSKTHTNILEIPELRQLITNIITASSSTASLPPYITTSQPSSFTATPRLHFTLHSPLTLGFTDSQGHYTGSTPTTTLSNIPGVTYERFGEVQFLSIPKTLAGNVVMQGTASGSFALDVEETQGNTILSDTSFSGIPTATSTLASLSVSPTTPPTASSSLLVDFDGNGTTDATLAASQGTTTSLASHIEAELQIKKQNFSVKVVGTSDATTTALVFSSSSVITDTIGNKTTLSFTKTLNTDNTLASLSLTGFSYNNTPTTTATGTIHFTYSTTTPTTTLIIQHLTLPNISATSTYNPTANTSLIESTDHGVHYSYIWTGQKVLRLRTQEGEVTWGFGS